MSVLCRIGVLTGLLSAIELCAGCHGGHDVSACDAATVAVDEPDGPADGDWRHWLTPPPPDQPQPRFACEQLKHTTGPIWSGKDSRFTWEIRNDGEAPLRVWLWA